jgi:hypothetical protein
MLMVLGVMVGVVVHGGLPLLHSPGAGERWGRFGDS